MKKISNKKIFIISAVLFLFQTTSVFALEYVPLEPAAFKDVTASATTSLGSYLGQVFNFGIAIAVTLALIMIIWGGIMYMTTDSWSGKEEGKTKITNALWGLGLALVSWLLLWTINPNLVNFGGSNNALLSTTTSQKI
jgi:succinate dehydrogenase/fumarate reductase cytochrome b subunit